mgnify:CR=1 FL=1
MTELYIVLDKTTVYHEGDERSRNYPGHGYPAYSESVDKVHRFNSQTELTTWLMRDPSRSKLEIFKCVPVKAAVTLNVDLS